jgi:hypothetical protein
MKAKATAQNSSVGFVSLYRERFLKLSMKRGFAGFVGAFLGVFQNNWWELLSVLSVEFYKYSYECFVGFVGSIFFAML